MDRLLLDTVLQDVRSFLSRQGVQWYKERGLPLRLGYLFYGPPGTGKSSFAFALAGAFGLPVFMLNLSLKSLTDSAVEVLFSTLPFHCIIMLEDIDATKPLKRDAKNMVDADPITPAGEDDRSDSSSIMVVNARASGRPMVPGKSGVTLSGLLNAIDGIGASEGRILIMSTNKIDDLDEALIRAGRADRIIPFSYTTKAQAQDLFLAAYTGTRWQPHTGASLAAEPEVEEYDEQDIVQLAKEFADQIRDEEFSPALLQQYFKDFRAQPRLAIEELDAWMEDPRAYLKPALQSRLVSGGKALKNGSDVLCLDRVKSPSPSPSVSAKQCWCSGSSAGTSAVEDVTEDLISLEDLGGYQEPSCFGQELEDSLVMLSPNPCGPLLDVSLFAEAY